MIISEYSKYNYTRYNGVDIENNVNKWIIFILNSGKNNSNYYLQLKTNILKKDEKILYEFKNPDMYMILSKKTSMFISPTIYDVYTYKPIIKILFTNIEFSESPIYSTPPYNFMCKIDEMHQYFTVPKILSIKEKINLL